jgi:nicotinate-nucleotide adenylyltransferase
MEKKESRGSGDNRSLRIGLFGGTFNPVHIGHLRAMVEIRESLFLDQLIIIPSAIPPHKPHGAVASASDRMSMLILALSGNETFIPSDVEIRRKGPSYSIDTVRHYKERSAPLDELYLIMGQDAFLDICTWRDYMALLKLVPVVVMSRPGKCDGNHGSALEAVPAFLKDRISPEYRASTEPLRFDHPSSPPVLVREVTPLDISSTRIRALIQQGKSIRYLVPDPVADYIKEKGLYL